jgi:hypothetical protein
MKHESQRSSTDDGMMIEVNRVAQKTKYRIRRSFDLASNGRAESDSQDSKHDSHRFVTANDIIPDRIRV